MVVMRKNDIGVLLLLLRVMVREVMIMMLVSGVIVVRMRKMMFVMLRVLGWREVWVCVVDVDVGFVMLVFLLGDGCVDMVLMMRGIVDRVSLFVWLLLYLILREG